MDSRTGATESSLASAMVPGLGQLMQGRPLAALLHFGSVLGYLAAIHQLGGGRAWMLALAFNAWSVFDAARRSRANAVALEGGRAAGASLLTEEDG